MYSAPDAPFEGEPTYKSDYHKHPFAMRQTLKPDEGSRGPHDPFDGRTGYRDEYIKHPMEAKTPREKECYKGPGAPLDGVYYIYKYLHNLVIDILLQQHIVACYRFSK